MSSVQITQILFQVLELIYDTQIHVIFFIISGSVWVYKLKDKYSTDPEDPKYFNSLGDFKNYIVNIGNIMNTEDFDDHFNKYQAQGLQFGQTPTLFKINCTAKVGRANYNLSAYVVLPAQPKPRMEEEPDPESGEPDPEPSSDPNPDPDPDPDPDETPAEEEQKTLLLEPRIVEISVG